MTYIAILVFIFLAWLIFKIYQFLKMGGTFTLVTRNVCFLYYQAKLVYPKLNEDAIRYIALLINSHTFRSKFPIEIIRDIVVSFRDSDWKTLCSYYTWAYSKANDGRSRDSLPPLIAAKLDDKIIENISWVENRIKTGRTRRMPENALRSIPQIEVMNIVSELEKHQSNL